MREVSTKHVRRRVPCLVQFRLTQSYPTGEAERLKAALETATLDTQHREQRTEQHNIDVQRMLEDKVHSLQVRAENMGKPMC